MRSLACVEVGMAVLFALVPTAQAHVSLDSPLSRYYQTGSRQADQSKQKAGPCGATGDARTTNASLITKFAPGETITVTWRETVQHPGHFRIAFDDDGQDFSLPGEALEAGVVILADDIADKSGSSGVSYSQEVTLPNVECDKCTLQLIQVMTTAEPPYRASDLYFNCADLVLEASAAGGSSSNPNSGGSSGVSGSARGGSSTRTSATVGAGGTLGMGGSAARTSQTGGSVATSSGRSTSTEPGELGGSGSGTGPNGGTFSSSTNRSSASSTKTSTGGRSSSTTHRESEPDSAEGGAESSELGSSSGGTPPDVSSASSAAGGSTAVDGTSGCSLRSPILGRERSLAAYAALALVWLARSRKRA